MYKQLLLAISLITVSAPVAAQPGGVTLNLLKKTSRCILNASDAVINLAAKAGRAVGNKANAFGAAADTLLGRIETNPDVFFAGVAFIPAYVGIICLGAAAGHKLHSYIKNKLDERRIKEWQRQIAARPTTVYDCYARKY